MDNIIETKVTLSEDSVQKILTAEVAKVVLENPKMIENIVNSVLFERPPKRNSYDKEPPTFFETAVKKTFEPMLQEIISEELQKKKPMITKIIKKGLNTKLQTEDFANRIIDAMSKFTSNIRFYLNED